MNSLVDILTLLAAFADRVLSPIAYSAGHWWFWVGVAVVALAGAVWAARSNAGASTGDPSDIDQ
jgi:hypothetical protein